MPRRLRERPRQIQSPLPLPHGPFPLVAGKGLIWRVPEFGGRGSTPTPAMYSKLPHRLCAALAALLAVADIHAAAPGAGIAFTWPTGSDAENHNAVRVRQFVAKWADIAPDTAAAASNHTNYDWAALQAEMDAAKLHGQKIMLQINAGAPSWVYNTVKQVGFSRGNKAPQFWDPEYINAYKTMVTALAAKIKSLSATDRDLFIGVRVQPLAFNTEISSWSHLPASEKDFTALADVNSEFPMTTDASGHQEGNRSKWILGTSGNEGGLAYGPDLDDTVAGSSLTHQQSYLQQMIGHFYAQFTSGTLAAPNSIHTALREADLSHHLSAAYLDGRFDLAYTMALDTGCEAATLDGTAAQRLRFDLFKNRCRNPGTPGNTLGYWEDWKESSTTLAGHTAVNDNPNQEFYWRQLIKLDVGITYGAVYGEDMDRFIAGGSSNSGYTAGVSFFNRYAGHVNTPGSSPGAWIAFVDVPALGDSPARTKLGWFLTHLNAGDAGVTDAKNIGIGVNHQGMYARRFGAGAVAKFSLAPAFASQLASGYKINVTWYNPSSATPANWFLSVRNSSGALVNWGGNITGGTGGWTTKTFTLTGPIPDGGGTLAAPDITITNVGGNAYFHMIEVTK